MGQLLSSKKGGSLKSQELESEWRDDLIDFNDFDFFITSSFRDSPHYLNASCNTKRSSSINSTTSSNSADLSRLLPDPDKNLDTSEEP